MKTIAISFALLAVLVRPAVAESDVSSLVERADMAYRGATSAGVFDMTVKTSSFERSYKVVLWGDEGGDKDRALVKILGPALWRGFGTLKVGDSLKLYNPRTNHVTVVSSSMLGDSWMGSHFSNDDLVKESKLAKHYEAELAKKWTADSDLGAASTFYTVLLTPKPSAPVAWARIEYTLVEHGDQIIPTRADYFRKQAQPKPSRTMTFSEVTDLGGKRLPSVMKVTVASKPGEYTRIVYKKLKLGVKIPKGKFTEQALKK